MSTDRTALTRRTFVVSAGALGALAACGTAANTLYASAPQAFGDESGDGESIDELREDKPELAKFLEKMQLTNSELGSLMVAINESKKDTLDAARDWMNENETVVARWLP